MKKTLVIHPDDRSTDFLKLIYKDKEDWTIINDCNIDRFTLKSLIRAYDRIIMMGHGSPSGLFNPKNYSLMIDDSFAPLLKTKETISIWCHSDQYFRRHHIEGFHTGMIISEVGEAYYVLGKTPLNKEETLENMEAFANIINKCIDDTPENMQKYILDNYNFNDDVTRFNRKNIIVLKDEKLKIFKYIYDNGKFYKFNYDAEEFNLFVRFYDKKNYLHKLNKENMNKILNQGDKGFILYSKEDWNMDVFKSAIKDYLTVKIQNLSEQLDKSLNLLDTLC